MKKINLIYCFVLIATLFSCDSDDTVEKDDIPNTPVKAFFEAEAYTIETVNAKSETLFDDEGYMFYIYDANVDCSGYENRTKKVDVSASNSAKFKFFLETDELKTGKFDGKGPFVELENGTQSFLGCDIEITEVTETTIKGKVFGGNKDDGTYIEGAFTANLCKAKIKDDLR